MKTCGSKFGTGKRFEAKARAAFTLTEMMISMSILTMVLAGVISSHLFGLKMMELTKAKLGASDDARAAISKLISEIRSAKRIQVGSGDVSSFAETEDGLPQEGAALQIYSSTNMDSFVRYFLDFSDQKLKRATNGGMSSKVIAQSITNTLPFTSENFSGVVLTNNQNNRVIGLLLQFYQIQYPVVSIGPGNYYDYYQLRTRVTRRVLE